MADKPPDIPKPTREDLLRLAHADELQFLESGDIPAKNKEQVLEGLERQWYEGHARNAARRTEGEAKQPEEIGLPLADGELEGMPSDVVSELPGTFRDIKSPDHTTAGTRVPGQAGIETDEERRLRKERQIETEIVFTMHRQDREQYDDPDTPKERRTAIFETYKERFDKRKRSEHAAFLKELDRTAKAQDLLHTIKTDPSKAHLPWPVNDSKEALLEWYEEMRKPVRPIPFAESRGDVLRESYTADPNNRQDSLPPQLESSDRAQSLTKSDVASPKRSPYDIIKEAAQRRALVDRIEVPAFGVTSASPLPPPTTPDSDVPTHGKVSGAHHDHGRGLFTGANVVATILVGIATQKWGAEVPDLLFILLCLIPVALWFIWLWTHPTVKKHRWLVYTYPRMSLMVMVLIGMITGGMVSALLWWTAQREQGPQQSNGQQQVIGAKSPESALPSPTTTSAVQPDAKSDLPIAASQSPAPSPSKGSTSPTESKPSGEVIDERQRQLTEQQKNELIQILTPHMEAGAGPRSVRIRYLRYDREAAQFASDFQDVFRIVGWNHGFEPMDYREQVPDGLSIAVKWNEVPPATARILADALKQLGFTVRMINSSTALREDDIALIIGVNITR